MSWRTTGHVCFYKFQHVVHDKHLRLLYFRAKAGWWDEERVRVEEELKILQQMFKIGSVNIIKVGSEDRPVFRAETLKLSQPKTNESRA